MKETRLYQRFAKLKADLLPMTWPKRIEHICTYYGYVIISVILVACVVGSLIINALGSNKQILMGGIYINVPMSDEGIAYIKTEYRNTINPTSKAEKVEVTPANITALTDAENADRNYYVLTQTIAMMTNQEVDYLIMDRTALEIYLSQEVFLDLNQVFTQEELFELGDKVITLSTTNDDGEIVHDAYPVAIEISHLQFIQDCTNSKKPVYIGFIANGVNSQRYHDFWEYLNAWQTGN